MSSIDLIILGELTDKDWSAYDLANFVVKRNIKEIAHISSPAVYKNLLKLAKAGYLDKRKEKVGNMPERKVYSITPKGSELYNSLLNKYVDQELHYRFDFNAVFYNLKRRDRKQAESLIHTFNNRLIEKRNQLEKEKLKIEKDKNNKGICVVEQHELINNALIEWVQKCSERYLTNSCK